MKPRISASFLCALAFLTACHPEKEVRTEPIPPLRFIEFSNSSVHTRSIMIQNNGIKESSISIAPNAKVRVAYPINSGFIFHFKNGGTISDSENKGIFPVKTRCEINDQEAGFGLSWESDQRSPLKSAVSSAYAGSWQTIDIEIQK